MATLSNIGLGSDGALSYDTIEQLQELDETNQIEPITTKITANETKTSDLSAITTIMSTFKSYTSSLADDTSFLHVDSNVIGDSVNVEASAGVSEQNFIVNVTSLATKDIIQSKSFLSETSIFASGAETISLDIDGTTYDFEVESSTTLSDLADEINSATNGSVIASLLNVGGDNPYKMILKSTETGSDQEITITSTGDAALNLGFQTNEFTATSPSGLASTADTLTFTVNSVDYTIDVEIGDSITEIAEAIEELVLEDELGASVENGVLVLNSDDSALSVSSANGSDTTFGLNSLSQATTTNHLQEASNAEFLYDGISIIRSSNEIDDIITGVDITLKETGTSSISISQNTDNIVSNLESFVSSYNELIANLDEATKYDTDSGNSGTFQGVSDIVSIKSTINRLLLSIDDEGRSFSDYGIALNDAGTLEFSQDDFDAKMSEDPSDVEDFFVGITTYNTVSKTSDNITSGTFELQTNDFTLNETNIEVSLNGTASENAQALVDAINEAKLEGIIALLDSSGTSIIIESSKGDDIVIGGDSIQLDLIGLSKGTTYGSIESSTGLFTTFNDLLADYVTGSDSILSVYENSLSDAYDRLIDERTSTQDKIDAKYDTMAARYIAYDAIISQLSYQSDIISTMIEDANSD